VRKASQHKLEAKKEMGVGSHLERDSVVVRLQRGGAPVTGRCRQRVHELNHTGVLLLDLRTEDKKR
jgi:hypothetical protein